MSDPFPPINLSRVAQPGTPGNSADATRMTNIESRLTELESRAVRPVASGFYYGPLTTLSGWSAGLSASTLTQNRLYAAPFICSQTANFSVFGIKVTTAVAASTIRIGVYEAGADGYPAALVADLGTVDSSVTGWRSNVCDLDLDPGAYWIAGACSHAGVAVSGINDTLNPGVTAYIGMYSPGVLDLPAIAIYRTTALSGGFSSLPTPFGATTISANCPAFQLGAT